MPSLNFLAIIKMLNLLALYATKTRLISGYENEGFIIDMDGRE